jgi:hypothetical protein
VVDARAIRYRWSRRIRVCVDNLIAALLSFAEVTRQRMPSPSKEMDEAEERFFALLR